MSNRVTKKMTPFLQASADKAILLVNSIDPQVNTMLAFVRACKSNEIPIMIFANKIDKIIESKRKELITDLETALINVVEPLSTKTGEGLDKAEDFVKTRGRFIVLGSFNSGKTSLVNALCGTCYETDDLPGTTLEFTTSLYGEDTVLIDTIGQLIDIDKPMMVSIDFNGCNYRDEKIKKVFEEEIDGLENTLYSVSLTMEKVIGVVEEHLKRGAKIITTGAGASALVAKEIAGQGTECGLPVMVFTNDSSEAQPISFSKGLAEEEMGLSRYISLAINPGDVIIGVSASGGTGFVYDVFKRAHKKGAVTIAITENLDTPLGKHSDYVLKSEAKPEGPSSSKIQTAHLVIGHTLMLVLADEMGVTADQSIQYMLHEKVPTKKMGIK